MNRVGRICLPEICGINGPLKGFFVQYVVIQISNDSTRYLPSNLNATTLFVNGRVFTIDPRVMSGIENLNEKIKNIFANLIWVL